SNGSFDGGHSYIEVPASKSLQLGTGDFAICTRVYTERQLDDIVGYVLDMYDPAARRGIALPINEQAARDLFDTEFAPAETGESILSGFRIKHFDSIHEVANATKFNKAVSRMRDSLAAAKSSTTDPWVLKRIEILDQDAQLMEIIYGILNEAAGYKT